MISLEVEIVIKAKLPSLTQRAIRKLERGGVVVTSVDTSANRCTVHGTLKVRATPLYTEPKCARSYCTGKKHCLRPDNCGVFK